MNMLTKNDLSKIEGAIQQETPKIVRKIVQEEIKPIKKDIKILKQGVTKIRKDVSVIISFFDREHMDLRKRVKKLEEHLHLPPLA